MKTMHCNTYSQFKMQGFTEATAATIYLFPSMTSMRSSALASYLRVMSALAIRYSLNMDLTESMSSSDCVHCHITTKAECYKKTLRLHFTCKVDTY